MRPARKGPENRPLPRRGRSRGGGFNEAGPQGAGKPEMIGEPRDRAARLQ